MTICYFGDYNPDYNRTRVLLKGLERNSIVVKHCRSTRRGWRAVFDLLRLHRGVGAYDLMIVGFGDNRWLPVVAKLISKKPVVWEPLTSFYDAIIFDRQLASPHSIKALYYWLLDWFGFWIVDYIVIDNGTHAKYLIDTFGVPRAKITHAYDGTDDDIFRPLPRSKKNENFEIEFHGKYIPLHGTWVLVRAAKALENENVHFTLIGGGQDYVKTKKLADELGVRNITFLPFMPVRELPELMRNMDVCVGHLGNVPRVMRSIPNKMYEIAAMARAGINVNSPALREVFTPGVDVIGVNPGDPDDFIRAVRELKNSGKADAIGGAALETYRKMATPDHIARRLLEDLHVRFPELPA